MKSKEKGAIVVEATIGLTSFILFVYMLLTILNICLVQEKVGVAVNTSAKELSQYSYLYSLTGVNKLVASAHEKGKLADGVVDDTAEGVEAIFNEVGSLSEGNSTIGSVTNTGKTAYNKFKSGVDTVSEDPKEFILSLLYASGTDLAEAGMDKAVTSLTKVLMKKNLKASSDGDVETFLRHCRVVPKGNSYFDGIDMSRSEVFHAGEYKIKLFAEYDVSMIRILNTDIKFHLSACGETMAWAIGDTTASKQLTGNTGEDNKENGSDPSGGGNNADKEKPDEEGLEEPTEEPTVEEPVVEEPKTEEKKTPAELAKEGTHNPNGEYAVLGRYNDNYIGFAMENGYTYYDLDNYDELKNEYTDQEMWKINAEFLQSQINQRKPFMLVSDPNNAPPGSSYAKEIRYLKDHDYEIVETPMGWKAVKKTG